MSYRTEFEKLYSAAETIDQKMTLYACFLKDEGIRKVLMIVRLTVSFIFASC